MAERAAGLGDQPGEAGDDRGQPGIEVADHEHAAGRDVDAGVARRAPGRSPCPPPAPTAAGRPRARDGAVAVGGAAHARPSSSRRNRAGSGRPAGSTRAARWTNDDAPLRQRRRAPRAWRWRTSSLVGEQADVDEPAAQLPRRPGHQLLHPADPQAQGLADDRRPVGRRRSAAPIDGRRAGDRPSMRGAGPTRGGTRASTTGSRSIELVERHALGPRLGDRRRGPARRRSRWPRRRPG